MAVNDIINDANVRADDAIADAQNFIDLLTEISDDESLGFTTVNFRVQPWFDLSDGYNIPDAQVLWSDAPVSNDVTIPERDYPDLPDGETPEVWTSANIPEFTDEPLPLNIPSAPTTPVPTAPGDPPERQITIGEWADYNLPANPDRDESTFPTVPVVNIDEVDMTLPDIETLVPSPSNSFEYVENEYSSELKDAITALLLSDVEDGGYGINVNDEQRLWDRARDRQAKLNETAMQEARRGIAARGFPLPPGSLYHAEAQIKKDSDAALADLNREIMLKRSDLYVQARQFAVQQGITLEDAMLRYTGAKYERALKAAIAAADLVLQYHNANVALVGLRIDVRRLYIALHEEQRASDLAVLENFKGQLQLLDAEEGRNEGRLKFFEALRRVVLERYEIQQLRDQHTMLDAEIEKLTLERSRIRAELFATKVRARSDEFDAYGKAISAEKLKVDLFASQVEAYGALVDAAVSEDRLKEARFDAELKALNDRRAEVQLALAKITAQLQRDELDANAQLRENEQLLEVWKRQQATQEFNVSTELQHDIARAKAYLDTLTTNSTHMQRTLAGVNQFKELKAAAAKSGMQMYETMIAGAENALSAVASIAES